ncbi:MAG: VWA-like domain-containing protein [Fusicatenibacter saccharivorans]
MTQSPTITAWSTTAVSLSSSRRRRGKETASKSWSSQSTHPARAKGEIVAKFLGETRSILEEKENFFSRWNVCLIQCDSFVQDVTMIHSPKEWEAYRETITIKGRGGTDFRPVFQKVEELRKQHVFRNLKALIYFTDGDGIYPEQKPDYETAFVFVRQTEKMNLVPKWAKKLLTEECTL